jgi:glycosyltransferase involved in cell wall biosynthesis
MTNIDHSTLTVIVPCFNEAESLPHILPNLIKFCKERRWTIVCINDGSVDKTESVLNMFNGDIKIITHKVNQGYGGAIKSGIKLSQTEYTVTIDADGQHYLEDIEILYNTCMKYDADMVIGSRKGLMSINRFREVGKFIIRTIARFLMPINIYDINSGMKLFRTKLAKKYIGLFPDTMAFSDTMTLVFIYQKHYVIEEPINIRKRLAGESTIGVNTAVTTLTELFNILTLFNPVRLFFPISFGLIIPGLLWGLWILLQGRGLSVGASFLMIMGVLVFLLGLLSEQITKIRRQLVDMEDRYY